MNSLILTFINSITDNDISVERKIVLRPLIEYIKTTRAQQGFVNLNFICTHNSRRSHLCQIWAHVMCDFFKLTNINSYSGGTENTALFYKVAETLTSQGFLVQTISPAPNPVYAFKTTEIAMPIICFSKVYNHYFNPQHSFAAVLTCSAANEACPIVPGANARIPVQYEDPKAYDNTMEMGEKYKERSIQIAQEMWWVMKNCV